MGNRVKKEGCKSLAQLQHYLRRDPYCCKLLASVSRYQGQLRQNCTQLRTEIGLVRKAYATTNGSCRALRDKSRQLQLALEKEQATTNQLKCKSAQLQPRLERLERELEPPSLIVVDEIPRDLRKDVAGLKFLTKALQRRIKYAPRLSRIIHPKGGGDPFSVLDLKNIVPEYNSDHYLTLGMVATLSTLIWGNVGFECKGVKLGKLIEGMEKKDSDTVGKAFNWMRRWIADTPEALAKVGMLPPY